MSFCDVRGENINLGSFTRYSGTGTIGKVIDLKEDDGQNWAKLEDSNLWYDTDSLEVVDEKDLININKSNDKDTIDKIKDLKEDLSDISMDSNACEGGG